MFGVAYQNNVDVKEVVKECGPVVECRGLMCWQGADGGND